MEALPLQRRPPGCDVPLNGFQTQIWNDGYRRAHSWRMCCASVRLRGPLQTRVLQDCVTQLVQRHESMRTRFITVDDVPRHQIDSGRDDLLKVVDLSGADGAAAEVRARKLAQEYVESTVDLGVGPLFDALLMRLSEDDHVLVAAFDHMVSDGLSFEILNRELWSLYQHAAAGRHLLLPELPIQFPDYAYWVHRTADVWRATHESYWRSRLSGAKGLHLPLDALPGDCPATQLLHFPMGKELSGVLRDIARQERRAVHVIVLSIYVAAMSRLFEQRDLLVVCASHGRHRPELLGMIGFLANHLFLRIELAADTTFIDLLDQVDAELSCANAHRDFDRVPLLWSDCATDLYFNWLPTTRTFKWLPMNSTFNWLPPKSRASGETALPQMQPFPLRPYWPMKFVPLFYEGEEGIELAIAHRSGMLTSERVLHIAQTIGRFAECLARQPRARIASVAPRPAQFANTAAPVAKEQVQWTTYGRS